MKVAVIYCSKHGTTEKVAKLLSQRKKNDEVHLVNLRQISNPDIDPFEEVVIGGSVHYGQIQKQVKVFCEKNKELLLKKRVGLFICCLLKEKAEEQFEAAFPTAIKDICKARGCFGGELVFSKMNLWERFIAKKVMGVKGSTSDINTSAIDQFISCLDNS